MPCPYFGNYPAEYNRAIHGPYNPATFYGKPDTPLANVKLNELGSWIYRRNIHPRAIIGGLSRAHFRYLHRYHGPKYMSLLQYSCQFFAVVCTYFYVINYKHLRHEKHYKYHW